MGLLLFSQSHHTDVDEEANPVGLEMVGTENTNEPLLKTGVQGESLGGKNTLKSNLLINERCAGPWEHRADGAKRGDGARAMEKEWFPGFLHQQWLLTTGDNPSSIHQVCAMIGATGRAWPMVGVSKSLLP